LAEDAREHLVRLAGGDARRSLTYLEAAAGAAGSQGLDTIDLGTAETAVDRAAVRYDRQGDQHYDVISAFIKSLRGSDATPPCTTWPGCSRPVRIRASSPVVW
jgi:putative ATPase